MDRFKELYELNNGVFDDEMLVLFEDILNKEFHGDSQKMDDFIYSLRKHEQSDVEKLQQENKELKDWKENAEEKINAMIAALEKITGEEIK